MSFLTPWFLVALGGMLLPVLIHLLTRDRIRRVEFSTLRFFVRSSGRILRRKRFREMALLALRAAVCGLLAVAFARPLLRGDEADDPAAVTARTARVILADVSASMGRGDAAGQLKQAAREALKELSARTDAVAVIAFADSATIEAPVATDFDRAVEAVDTLAATEGATNIPQALRAADEHLRRARAATRQIILISDLQRSGWQQLKEDFRLSPGVKLTIRPVRVADPGRVAVLAASFPETATLDREPETLSIQLVNYGDAPADGVEVTFRIGGQIIRRAVNLRPHGTGVATVRHVFEAPGDNRGLVQAAGAGIHYFNTRVIPKIKVLVLDGASEGGKPSEAAFFLGVALQPDEKTATPFDARRVDAAAAAPADLADVRVAVLVNVRTVAPAVREALRGLLRRGGGLWFLPGGKAEPEAFAAAFGDLAPCKLRQARAGHVLRTGGIGAALAGIDFQHPIFEVFSHPRHGDLSLPRFHRYWEVTDSQLSQVLAKFDDNRPAVIAKEIEGGVSMMLAACPESEWTDLPRQTTFLPLVWQMLKYLAARSEQRTAYVVGDSLPAPAGLKLFGPDGQAAADGMARKAGFYTLKDDQGREACVYAVNREAAEADPAVVAADEIVAAVQRPQPQAAAAASASGRDGPQRDDRGLWWWIVAAVIILLAAELLLGNKTLRH